MSIKLFSVLSLRFKDYKIKYKFKPALYLGLSLLIVAFGQPAWSPILGVLSSAVGFALFWAGYSFFEKKSNRFFISLLWFMATEAIHLSWMTSTEFQGYYIYGVYLFVLFMMGLQFSLLSSWIKPKESLSWAKVGALAGLWAIFEYARLFFICGFPFNPVGLSLTSTLVGLQGASIGGIYGLSFWVILTNLAFLKWWQNRADLKNLLIAFSLMVLPYLYGGVQCAWHQKKIPSQHYKALLVQTGLTPPEKTGFRGFENMVPPIDQWAMIYQYLLDQGNSKIDLIALPERTVPLSSHTKHYSIYAAKSMINFYFGQKGLLAMPEIEDGQEYVDNRFFAQTLANLYRAQVVVGLEHYEPGIGSIYEKFYASAYCFYPSKAPQIYHKQILLPLVEYLPFEWCKSLARKYDVYGWYERGDRSAVFSGPINISPSICMEEMYSFIVRGGRLLNADLLLNITNDGWYPNSRLPKQHFDHGRIRAVENGLPLVRACNTGVTGAVDALGREIASLKDGNKKFESAKGALYVEVPVYRYSTWYSWWGDSAILILSGALVALWQLQYLRIKKKILSPAL